jgi:hypothetical protein
MVEELCRYSLFQVIVISAIRHDDVPMHLLWKAPIGMLRNGKVLAWVGRETPLSAYLFVNVGPGFIKIGLWGSGAGVGGGIGQNLIECD